MKRSSLHRNKLCFSRISRIIPCVLLCFFFYTKVYSITELVVFSHPHGFYTQSFQLSLSSSTGIGDIFFTLDGSLPELTGNKYSRPIFIDKTTVVRAVVVVQGVRAETVATQSYIFLNDVLRQSNHPDGYPTQWGPYTAIQGTSIADYEMDPELLANPTFADEVFRALQQLPTLSLVTDRGHLFSHTPDPQTGGIYIYTGAPITNFTYAAGRGWERPVSIEYFDLNQQKVQIDAGLRLHGGHGRRPEKSPKHSFLLHFNLQYGYNRWVYPVFGNRASPSFKRLILRAGFGNSWVHHENAQRLRATYMEDAWTKDTQQAMGHPASQTTFVHLYLNGLYWGVYALAERMDADFAAYYFGGNDHDYDVIKDYTEVANGNIEAWNKMMSLANAGLETNEKYMHIQGRNPDGSRNAQLESMLDVISLTDYMLINFYGGNSDWDHHNWVAVRNRANPGTGFKFVCWDSEMMFGSLTANILNENNPNCPSSVYQQLLHNAAYRRLLANRIQRHLFNNGALTPDSVIARWNRRRAVLENTIQAESARWGDYRRDVHRFQTAGPFDVYTKEKHWTPRNNTLVNTFFTQRTNTFIAQLRHAGLFPSFDAPVFFVNGTRTNSQTIAAGSSLTISSATGLVYYTLDGTDPLHELTGVLMSNKATLYTQAITLNHSAIVVARTLHNHQWSAANVGFYLVPDELQTLRMTEIHYNPLSWGSTAGSELEFIEIKNTGKGTFNLSGCYITGGIQYTFPTETFLKPGEWIVLASNSNAFLSRYQFLPFGEYDGQLDNRGEPFNLVTSHHQLLWSVAYQNSGLWPSAPNGEGYSLVPVDIQANGNLSDANYWRASHMIGGSPGADDLPFTSLQNALVTDKIEANIYPNPFSTETTIEYPLSENAQVRIALWNMAGQQMRVLLEEYQLEGKHSIRWDGNDHKGIRMPAGIYFVQISMDGSTLRKSLMKKLMLTDN